MGKTVKLKGTPARSFFAKSMVDDHGEKALERVAKGSPMEKAVKAELEYQREKLINESFADSQGCY